MIMDRVGVVIITGLSGAGKTHVLHQFEDMGFFCVDNFIPTLIPEFLSQIRNSHSRVALVMDTRSGVLFDGLIQIVRGLDAGLYDVEILFLEASDEVLVKRFSETRRKHPLTETMGLLEGIHQERHYLAPIRGESDIILDTSNLTPQQLKEKIDVYFGDGRLNERMAISIISFGYKFGIPIDADLVFDVRFLPNPHYIEDLRPYNGLEEVVKNFVLSSGITQDFLSKFIQMITYLIPHYQREGKTHLTIAIGCTGGKHRSVAISHHLAQLLLGKNYRIIETHRDIDKDLPRKPQAYPSN